MNKIETEKKFIKMMIPICSDIIEGKDVNISEIILKQNVFMYAITGDYFFIQKINDQTDENNVQQIKAFISNIMTIDFKDIPKAIGMSHLWWNGMKEIFESVYPEIF